MHRCDKSLAPPRSSISFSNYAARARYSREASINWRAAAAAAALRSTLAVAQNLLTLLLYVARVPPPPLFTLKYIYRENVPSFFFLPSAEHNNIISFVLFDVCVCVCNFHFQDPLTFRRQIFKRHMRMKCFKMCMWNRDVYIKI